MVDGRAAYLNNGYIFFFVMIYVYMYVCVYVCI